MSYMTPDKNFRLTKRSKTMTALFSFVDNHQRGAFKAMMVQGQLAEEAARRASLKSNDKNSNKNAGKPRGAVAPD